MRWSSRFSSLALELRSGYLCRRYKVSVAHAKTARKPPAPPPSILARQSPYHHDLPSYLSYASSKGLSENSTTYRGTVHEYTAARSLTCLHFTLYRVGHPHDHGIDLLGHWSLPSFPSSHPLPIIVQCKASLRITSGDVRALEGAFAGAPVGWRRGAMAILVGRARATMPMREALARSRAMLGYCCVGESGRVVQFLWNQAAEEGGLCGLSVGAKHKSKKRKGELGREIVLLWEGKPLPFVEPVQEVKKRKIKTAGKDGVVRSRGKPKKTVVEDSAETAAPSKRTRKNKKDNSEAMAKKSRPQTQNAAADESKPVKTPKARKTRAQETKQTPRK